MHLDDQEEDEEAKAERERRRRERGKKRYEENYDYVNEEFFSSWQNRTKSKVNWDDADGAASGDKRSIETMFDGKDLQADVELTFDECIQEGGVAKEIAVMREDICGSCKGTRERAGGQSNPCYACKGTGVKEDALFKERVICNTCDGHGSMVQSPC